MGRVRTEAGRTTSDMISYPRIPLTGGSCEGPEVVLLRRTCALRVRKSLGQVRPCKIEKILVPCEEFPFFNIDHHCVLQSFQAELLLDGLQCLAEFRFGRMS